MVQGSLHLPGVQKIIQRQDYTPEEALAEFIDNSYSARVGANVRVQIDITKSANGRYTLRIDDDASGIPSDSLAQVLSYGLSMGKGNNNEHGAGMKQAASSGNTYLRKIESNAAAGDAFAVEFKNANALYDPVQIQKSERKRRGTMFELELPPNHALLNEDSYAHIVQRLQVMYQKTLGQSLFITMSNATLNNDKARTLIPDNASKYVYNPAFDNNTWLVKGHVLKGNGWSAKINVGYLPERSNPFLLRKGALPDANEQSQYNAEQKGLYIFKKERLIGQLDAWKMHASLPKVFAGHSDNLKNLVLEIEVDDGIATVPTKNALANPPQDDNTVDTPLTELQNGLYKYLNRLTLDLQPDQTLISPHLLSTRGIHTLMQTLDLAGSPKEKVGPASLDLSSLDPSWRAGWKTIAPFGDWKIWTHPLHDVCLVMHKKGANTQLGYIDVPNYALLQMHIEKTLERVQRKIILMHKKDQKLDQRHVPERNVVYVRDVDKPADILTILTEKASPTRRSPNSTKFGVVCIETGTVFKSYVEAAEWVNKESGSKPIAPASIRLGISRHKPIVHGLTWAIADPYKVYSPTQKNARPNVKENTGIICLETGDIFNTRVEAIDWMNKRGGFNIKKPTNFETALKNKKPFCSLSWEIYDPNKIYVPVNKHAVPIHPHDSKPLICHNTQETFATIAAFTKWLNTNTPARVSIHETGRVLAGLDKEVHGYTIGYAP